METTYGCSDLSSSLQKFICCAENISLRIFPTELHWFCKIEDKDWNCLNDKMITQETQNGEFDIQELQQLIQFQTGPWSHKCVPNKNTKN